jgi:hypothetical protein
MSTGVLILSFTLPIACQPLFWYKRGVVFARWKVPFIEDVDQRLEKARKQWEAAKKAARESKSEADRLADLVAALQRVRAEYVSGVKNEPAELRVVEPSTPALTNEGNKTEMVRSLIKRQAPDGLTPAEIRAKLKETGADFNDTYVYAVLLRSKKAGKIRERNGKYYFVEEEESKKTAAS